MTSPNGIRCAHCKGRHATVAQVKLCAHRAGQPAPKPKVVTADEAANAEWVSWKDLAARREQSQEETAYLEKMARDDALEVEHLRRVAAGRG